MVLGRLWVHLDLIIGALGGFARGFVEVEKLYKPPGQLIADPERLRVPHARNTHVVLSIRRTKQGEQNKPQKPGVQIDIVRTVHVT